jgi:hypothetical protein
MSNELEIEIERSSPPQMLWRKECEAASIKWWCYARPVFELSGLYNFFFGAIGPCCEILAPESGVSAKQKRLNEGWFGLFVRIQDDC